MPVELKEPDELRLEGVIQEAPVRRTGRLEVLLGRLRTDEGESVSGAALLWLPPYASLRFGDALRVSGDWVPSASVEPVGYSRYLGARGLVGIMKRPEVELLARDRGPPFLLALHRLRARWEQVAERLFAEPEASLLNGVVLGSRGRMPPETVEHFRRSGTSHVIVVSGSNVAVVAALMLAAARPLGRRGARLLAGGLVLGYCLLVGLEPPVVRAGLMAGLYLLAQELGRPAEAVRALLTSGLLMLVWRPGTLWEVSFQLSFAATLGLILAARPLQKRLGRWGDNVLGETLAMTTAAQVFTAPVLLAHFHSFSLVSLPANLLIVPLQPLTLVLGAALLGLALIHEPLALAASWLLWPILHGTIEVVTRLGSLPWAAVEMTPGLARGLSVAVLLTLGAIAGRPRLGWPEAPAMRRTVPALLGGAALLVLTLVLPEIGKRPDGLLHVWFIDVGQGDGILMRLPAGQFVLLDGGPDEGLAVQEVGRRLPLWQRRLDAAFISHPDEDHLIGSLGALRSFPAALALAPAGSLTDPAGQAWAEVAKRAGAEVMEVTAPFWLLAGPVEMEVLHPSKAGTGNLSSLVLLLSMGAITFLLPGDAEGEDVSALLASGRLPPVTVLAVPHHGSQDRRVDQLLAAVRPAAAVISVGQDNRHGHPHPSVLQALQSRNIPVFRTDEGGTVEWITDGRDLWVRTERSQ